MLLVPWILELLLGAAPAVTGMCYNLPVVGKDEDGLGPCEAQERVASTDSVMQPRAVHPHRTDNVGTQTRNHDVYTKGGETSLLIPREHRTRKENGWNAWRAAPEETLRVCL